VRRGWFEDTLPVSRADVGPIAVLHVDGDWYDSVRCVLENLHEQVVPGGAIVIDDYGAVLGARRATRDFRRAAGDDAPLIRIDQTGVYWRKR
jgi:O-methyltransferase